MVDLLGLTNAMTDVVVNVTDAELSWWGLEKGHVNGIVNVPYASFLKEIAGREMTQPAGSPANVIYTAASLGLSTALIGCVGNDALGRAYIQAARRRGIKSLITTQRGQSGLCFILVTPDGERTSVAVKGVSDQFTGTRQKAHAFHTSAYELLANPVQTDCMMNYAKQHGTIISFDLADSNVVKKAHDIDKILSLTDILFATEDEAAVLESELRCPILVLKRGMKGSVVFSDKTYLIPSYRTKVVNTNGVGDAYAAGFLFGYLHNFSLEECGHMGSYLASRICSMQGAHL